MLAGDAKQKITNLRYTKPVNIVVTLQHMDDLLLSELEDMLDEERPCENANHSVDPMHHGGPGEWYLTAKVCQHCGIDRGTRLVCDPFAQYLMKGGAVGCGKCLEFLGFGMEAYKSITRKGKENGH